MNWRTGARLGVAVVGLSTAVTVFVLARRQPPPPPLPPDLPTLEKDLTSLGGPGRLAMDKDGEPSLDLTFNGSRAYADGRTRFEDAVARGLGEASFVLHAKVMEARLPTGSGEKPEQIHLSGGMKLEASDGLIVEGESGTYEDSTGRLSMPGSVTFRRGRLSGTSTGAEYDRATDTVVLQSEAVANVQPDAAGKGSATATAARMFLARGQHTVRLEEKARIDGELQVLSGNQAVITFADDESALKFLELRGAARVEPKTGAPADQPVMSADHLTMSFHADGVTMQHATLTGGAVLTTGGATGNRSIRAAWIDLFTGKDGRTVTSLGARDQVVVEIPATATAAGRVITSSTLTARGDEKRGLTSARFEGSPRFVEQATRKSESGAVTSQPRTGSAQLLVLTLGGQLDAIEQAEFQQNVRFEDGRVTAEAELGIYDDARDVLQLRGSPKETRRLSRVTTADMQVDAREIDVFLETEDLDARGSVTSRAVRAKEGAAAGSLFEADEPVIGSANTLEYKRASGLAVYRGAATTPARLSQKQTSVIAERLEFTEKTSDLRASGRVQTKLQMLDETSAGSKTQVYDIRSDTLAYDDTRRVADFRGTLVTLTTADGVTESRQLLLELAGDSRTLQRLRAEGGVYATLSDGYEFAGESLVSQPDTEIYVLTGKPARVKSRDKDRPAGGKADNCSLTTGDVLELNRKTGGLQSPGSGRINTTTTISCAESLRPKR